MNSNHLSLSTILRVSLSIWKLLIASLVITIMKSIHLITCWWKWIEEKRNDGNARTGLIILYPKIIRHFTCNRYACVTITIAVPDSAFLTYFPLTHFPVRAHTNTFYCWLLCSLIDATANIRYEKNIVYLIDCDRLTGAVMSYHLI